MGNLLRAIALVSVASGAAAAEEARAPSADIYMQQRGPNTLDVTVVGESLPANDGLGLYADHPGPPARLVAVKRYEQGDEPMAIVFVMSGQEIWTGNDSFESDDNIRFPDMLGPLEYAIDGLDLTHRLPKGSQASIVTYASGSKIRVPMAPIELLHGTAFGTQRDYYNQIGTDLVSGLMVGMDELERTQAHRKLLVVLGDGCDTNSESAAPQLIELKKRAAKDNIHTAAIVYKTALSCETNDIARMVPTMHMMTSINGIAGELEHVLQESTQIFYASFDISDLGVWDGRPHDLTLSLDGVDQDPVTVSFQDRRSHGTWWKSWWAQLVFGFAGLGVLVMLARRSAR